MKKGLLRNLKEKLIKKMNDSCTVGLVQPWGLVTLLFLSRGPKHRASSWIGSSEIVALFIVYKNKQSHQNTFTHEHSASATSTFTSKKNVPKVPLRNSSIVGSGLGALSPYK